MILAAALAWGGVEPGPAPPGLERAYAARRVALVVGVEDYDDPRLGSLEYAVEDARDIAAVLRDPARGGFDRVEVIEGRATRLEVWARLRDVGATLQRDDTFVMYFAGHGTLDVQGGTKLFLLASDSVLSDPARTGVPLDDLEAALRRMAPRRQVLAVDACYSGSGRSALAPEAAERLKRLRGPAPAPTVPSLRRYEARLFAAHYDQPAREAPELENGVYTWYLVDALRGAGDLDGDGLVNVLEAHQWAMEGTLRFTGGQQLPWLRATVVGRDALFLAGDPARRRKAERAIVVSDGAMAGVTLRVDGQTRGGGSVEPGPHHVQVEADGKVVVEGDLTVRPGERLDATYLVEHRGGAVLAGAGAGWAPSPAVTPAIATQAVVWWWPQDTGGGRWGVGAALGPGLGPTGEFGVFPSGEAEVRVAWTHGDTIAVGPSLAAGVILRRPYESLQAGPMVAAGAHVRWTGRVLFVALDPALRLAPMAGEAALFGVVPVTVGARF